jgi:hypothetical protein
MENKMDFDKLKNLLIGGSIVTQKSDVLISNIHTVKDKWFGIVVGGEVLTVNWNNTVTRTPRYTTIDLSEY